MFRGTYFRGWHTLNNFLPGNEEKVKLKVRHILEKKLVYSMKSNFCGSKMFIFHGTNFCGQATICIFRGT